MSATGKTSNYEIPIFNPNDTTGWLNGFNPAMEKIDSELLKTNQGVAENAADISSINTEIADLKTVDTGYGERLTAVENKATTNTTNIANLQTAVNSNTTGITTLNETVEQHTEKITALERDSGNANNYVNFMLEANNKLFTSAGGDSFVESIINELNVLDLNNYTSSFTLSEKCAYLIGTNLLVTFRISADDRSATTSSTIQINTNNISIPLTMDTLNYSATFYVSAVSSPSLPFSTGNVYMGGLASGIALSYRSLVGDRYAINAGPFVWTTSSLIYASILFPIRITAVTAK